MKITYTLKKSQQKQALFQPDKWILQLTSTSWRFKDVKIKGGAQKAEKERFIMEQRVPFPSPFQQYAQFKRLISSKSLELMLFNICTRLTFKGCPSVPMMSFKKKNISRETSRLIFFFFSIWETEIEIQFSV